MIITPRDYQEEAVKQTWQFVREGQGNPLICAPTGSGKSVMLAMLLADVRKWGGFAMLVTHNKELLEQNAAAFEKLVPERAHEVGIYSAGLGDKQTDMAITFAGIQSCYKKAHVFLAPKVIIIDEAHLVSPKQETMYRQFLADMRQVNNGLIVIGLTATPFRLDSGRLYGQADSMFTELSYVIEIQELIERGHLCPVTSKRHDYTVDVSGVPKRGGEFVQGDLARAFDDDAVTGVAVAEAVQLAADRNHWLVFCSGVDHAHHVAKAFRNIGWTSATITGDTPAHERAQTIADFRAGKIRVLTNANVLTTGFDAPLTDCVMMLRATNSKSLYVQMVGRGMRPAKGKVNCLLLDYGGNIERHGPVDSINVRDVINDRAGEGDAPVKICPDCEEICATAVRKCPACGHEFPPPAKPLEQTAGSGAVLKSQVQTRTESWPVIVLEYKDWAKRGNAEAPHTLCVTYCPDIAGLRQVREWVCVEHNGWARNKAADWLRERKKSDRLDLDAWTLDGNPITAGALADAAYDVLESPKEVRVQVGGKYPEITGYEWEREPGADYEDEPTPELVGEWLQGEETPF